MVLCAGGNHFIHAWAHCVCACGCECVCACLRVINVIVCVCVRGQRWGLYVIIESIYAWYIDSITDNRMTGNGVTDNIMSQVIG